MNAQAEFELAMWLLDRYTRSKGQASESLLLEATLHATLATFKLLAERLHDPNEAAVPQ